MSDKKVTEETLASTPLSGAEKVRIVQGGASVQCTVQDIADLTPGGVVGGASAALEAVRVYRTAAQSIPNNTETALTFDVESFDTSTLHDNAVNTSRLTCATAGKYFIKGNAEFAANATGVRQLRIRLNGSTIIAAENRTSASGSTATKLGVGTVYELAAGDYVELLALQDSGGALNVNNGLGTTSFSMTLQGGTPAAPTLELLVAYDVAGSYSFDPADYDDVEAGWIDIYAGGGAGAGGGTTNAGPGGGSAEYTQGMMVAFDGATSVTVGAGGASGAAGADGSDGGDSSFGSYTMKGGKKGVGASNTAGVGGGVRGGAAGTPGTAESPSAFGGGGGGQRGNAGASSAGYVGGSGGTGCGGGGAATPEGNGGNGGTPNNAGQAGQGPGAGGGGGGNGSSTVGGAGHDGLVRVYAIR